MCRTMLTTEVQSDSIVIDGIDKIYTVCSQKPSPTLGKVLRLEKITIHFPPYTYFQFH
jgi:hypothetical protein